MAVTRGDFPQRPRVQSTFREKGRSKTGTSEALGTGEKCTNEPDRTKEQTWRDSENGTSHVALRYKGLILSSSSSSFFFFFFFSIISLSFRWIIRDKRRQTFPLGTTRELAIDFTHPLTMRVEIRSTR